MKKLLIYLILVFPFFVSANGRSYTLSNKEIQELTYIQAYFEYECKYGEDENQHNKVCRNRDYLINILRNLGVCKHYGKDNYSDVRWGKCDN